MDYKKVGEPLLPKGIPKTSSKGCISTYDLVRLVERVHELNQGEQEEPTEPDTEEPTNEIETEANSVTDTEEEESDKESNSPKPVEGSENPEPKVEPEEEPVKLSVELESTTPMLTFASGSKKSELSILMDMCKFMHNQQQTYWKYAKIKILLRIFLILLFLSSQMLSLRHGWKILTMQAEMELKKTRGMSQENKRGDFCLIIYLFLGP
ncbi:hypothetical protein PVK06_020039 [Gossypium arboreum]|uniref:Uncharacterized protein n=1 Tax=Gossypium arboreum TaxID=29729 RepID=A0ABR0PLH6_GOSAR|nr:hypothetical protein PVK06_020039 [Gossypium arboreum]